MEHIRTVSPVTYPEPQHLGQPLIGRDAAINIKESHEGLDFFFAQVNDASAFVDFLKSVVPVNTKSSRQMISEGWSSHGATSHGLFDPWLTANARRFAHGKEELKVYLLCRDHPHMQG